MSAAIVSRSEFLGALERASRVALSAYVLEVRSPVVRGLEACADRGGRVSVILDGAPFAGRTGSADAADRNRHVAAELRDHGVAVTLTAPDAAPVHMKAAVVDGTAFLDERNWPASGADTIVATSEPDDVAVVASAIAGRPASDARLATEKREALAREADAIATGSGDRVDVESESFGSSAVSKALWERAERGARVRLLVARREYDAGGAVERAALARLARSGVAIRIGEVAEKAAIAGDRGWVGSANATFDVTPTLDWGLALSDPPTLGGLEADFERNWARGSALRA